MDSPIGEVHFQTNVRVELGRLTATGETAVAYYETGASSPVRIVIEDAIVGTTEANNALQAESVLLDLKNCRLQTR